MTIGTGEAGTKGMGRGTGEEVGRGTGEEVEGTKVGYSREEVRE